MHYGKCGGDSESDVVAQLLPDQNRLFLAVCQFQLYEGLEVHHGIVYAAVTVSIPQAYCHCLMLLLRPALGTWNSSSTAASEYSMVYPPKHSN